MSQRLPAVKPKEVLRALGRAVFFIQQTWRSGLQSRRKALSDQGFQPLKLQGLKPAVKRNTNVRAEARTSSEQKTLDKNNVYNSDLSHPAVNVDLDRLLDRALRDFEFVGAPFFAVGRAGLLSLLSRADSRPSRRLGSPCSPSNIRSFCSQL
jgi:hypothetical protein